jgi:hypothetical protein
LPHREEAKTDADLSRLIDPEWIRTAAGDASLSDRDCLRLHDIVGPNALFDVRFYRERYGDEIPRGVSCLEHFVERISTFAYNPNRTFSTEHWRETAGLTLPQETAGAACLEQLANESRFAVCELKRHWDGSILTNDFVLGGAPLPSQEICIFAHYDANGRVQDYVLDYIDALAAEGVCILFVSSCSTLTDSAVANLQSRVWRVVLTTNQARDFGLYSIGVRLLADRETPIVLSNDSVFCAYPSLDQLFSAARTSEAPITGAIDSWVHDWHLQSFFLHCKQEATQSYAWREFWRAYRPHHEKWFVINSNELGFSRFMINANLKLDSVWRYGDVAARIAEFPASEWRNNLLRRGEVANATVELWEILLGRGFPFLKREVLRGQLASDNLAELANVISGLARRRNHDSYP